MKSAVYQTAPRAAHRPRRTIWLSLGLGAIAFMPFILIFAKSAEQERGPLILTEGDQSVLGDGLRMLSPSFTGRTRNGEPYVVTSDWALPDSPNPNRVDLRGVEATVTLKDGRIATMLASDGTFFPRIERLRLEKGVAATSSDGYRVDTEAVTVDYDARTLRTDGPVQGSGPRGAIRADSLEALDADDRIVKFIGNVRVIFEPEVEDPETGDAAPSASERESD